MRNGEFSKRRAHGRAPQKSDALMLGMRSFQAEDAQPSMGNQPSLAEKPPSIKEDQELHA